MCRPESKRRWYGPEGEKSQMWVVVSGRGALPWNGRRDQPLRGVIGLERLQLFVGVERYVRFLIVVRLVLLDPILHLKTAVRALIHHDFSIIVGCQQLHVRFTLGTRLCQWN